MADSWQEQNFQLSWKEAFVWCERGVNPVSLQIQKTPLSLFAKTFLQSLWGSRASKSLDMYILQYLEESPGWLFEKNTNLNIALTLFPSAVVTPQVQDFGGLIIPDDKQHVFPLKYKNLNQAYLF